jgi:Fe2+ or Zn2+ uptake regulation protein
MIDSCPVERLEHAIGKKYGYIDLRHSLEFFGKCPECHSSPSDLELSDRVAVNQSISRRAM